MRCRRVALPKPCNLLKGWGADPRELSLQHTSRPGLRAASTIPLSLSKLVQAARGCRLVTHPWRAHLCAATLYPQALLLGCFGRLVVRPVIRSDAGPRHAVSLANDSLCALDASGCQEIVQSVTWPTCSSVNRMPAPGLAEEGSGPKARLMPATNLRGGTILV